MTSLKYAFKLLTRQSQYIIITLLVPIYMLFFITFFLTFRTDNKIIVIDQEQTQMSQDVVNSMKELDGITVEEGSDVDAAKSSVLLGNSVLVVVLEENFSESVQNHEKGVRFIAAEGKNDLIAYFKDLIDYSVAPQTDTQNPITYRETHKAETPVNDSMGFMIYKMFTGIAMLSDILIMERIKGVRKRIYLSGKNPLLQLSGISAVCLVNSIIPTTIYFFLMMLFKFNFGLKHKIIFLLIMLLANVLATGYTVLISTFCKTQEFSWSLLYMIPLPMCILSGAVFDFHLFPKPLQVIGSICPTRWVIETLEQVQHGQGLAGALPYIIGILVVSALLYTIGAVRMNRKQV